MMAHEEAMELLPSFALHAVEPHEYGLIQEHVATCARCQAEMDAYYEVTAALGNSVTPPPRDLWEAISRGLVGEDDRQEFSVRLAVSPPLPVSVPVPVPLPVPVPPPLPVSLWPGTNVADVDTPHRFFRGAHASRVRFVTATSAAVGAVAVVSVLGIGLTDAGNQVAHLRGAVRDSARAQVAAAMKTADHTIIYLSSTDHHRLAQFVLLPNGRGYLVRSHLRPLPFGETYQLWGVMDEKTISLGILGRRPHLATFTSAASPGSAGSPSSYRLGVTVEGAGGAVRPSGPMLATGAA
jgi:anti-sigma-K factor RskA